VIGLEASRAPHEPPDDREELRDPRCSIALLHRYLDALLDVSLQQQQGHGFEAGACGRELIEDLDATSILIAHALDPRDLPLDPAQPQRDLTAEIPVEIHGHSSPRQPAHPVEAS
jgi:hypothetical protein